MLLLGHIQPRAAAQTKLKDTKMELRTIKANITKQIKLQLFQRWFWFACMLAPSLLLVFILLSEKKQFQLTSTQVRSYSFEDVNTKHTTEALVRSD